MHSLYSIYEGQSIYPEYRNNKKVKPSWQEVWNHRWFEISFFSRFDCRHEVWISKILVVFSSSRSNVIMLLAYGREVGRKEEEEASFLESLLRLVSPFRSRDELYSNCWLPLGVCLKKWWLTWRDLASLRWPIGISWLTSWDAIVNIRPLEAQSSSYLCVEYLGFS